jgi:hypothetical protein
VRGEALVLLEGDLDAQRLLVTWHLVGEEIDSAEGAIDAADPWARVSGVAAGEVARAVPVLWANGILLPEGEVAPEALSWVRRRLAKDLPSRPAKR